MLHFSPLSFFPSLLRKCLSCILRITNSTVMSSALGTASGGGSILPQQPSAQLSSSRPLLPFKSHPAVLWPSPPRSPPVLHSAWDASFPHWGLVREISPFHRPLLSLHSLPLRPWYRPRVLRWLFSTCSNPQGRAAERQLRTWTDGVSPEGADGQAPCPIGACLLSCPRLWWASPPRGQVPSFFADETLNSESVGLLLSTGQ